MTAPAVRRRWYGRLALGAAGLAAVAALARPVARLLEPSPTVTAALRQLREGRGDRAEATLGRVLAGRPGDRDAALLLARLWVERPGPRPEGALGLLKGVRPRDPRARASVLVLEGKAYSLAYRYREAEADWREALRLDPMTAEACWLLIQQYDLQGRSAEARRLAIRSAAVEPDPHDRARLLLEPAREDVERLAAAGLITRLAPVVRRDPGDRRSGLAYGRALVKEGRTAEGLALLRRLAAGDPLDPDGWDALLGGLADGGEVDALAAELAGVPAAVAAGPRLALYRGLTAQARQDAAAATAAFGEAVAARPHDPKLLHRLARALRLARRDDEAREVERREADANDALRELKEVYSQIAGVPTFGLSPEPLIDQRLAALRERLGHPDEALAWHRQVLRDDPQNSQSLEAVARLVAADADADRQGDAGAARPAPAG